MLWILRSAYSYRRTGTRFVGICASLLCFSEPAAWVDDMIAKKWIGSYRYDNEKHRKAVGWEQTVFEVEFVSWHADEFVGKIVDDPDTGGTPGTGEIVGSISGGRIEFVKKMPVLTLISGIHTRVTRSNRKHPDIFYAGTVSPDGTSMSGEWRIKLGFGFFGLWPTIFLPMSGTWTMTAVEERA